MYIQVDDVTGSSIQQLIMEHLADMEKHSPPESIHALPVEELRVPEVTVWSVWDDNDLLGCGAIKELSEEHGEIKSMRTSSQHLRKGVARHVLTHLLQEAKKRGYKRMSLETGSMSSFDPARRLYESFDFQYCQPFGTYRKDPNSLFMTKEL
ncbi:GNAT family N-acetyltransferase [Bacillus sp. NPDC077027]|uniref:GNAT family N-acetyltransferase n=1 Tax=Bacillus sp. NPDC077027 TaxID=3390548 RepID=UPI003D01AF1D